MSIDSSVLRFREGELVYLRQLRPEDITARYVRWVNDQEVTQYMRTGTYPSSYDDVREYVETHTTDSDTVMLAIITDDDDVHIGNIKLGPVDWINQRAELSILIGDKNYWGKGMGTEAIKLTTQYGFNKLNLHKVYAGCYGNNSGMKKAFKKAGFSEEGRLVDHAVYQGEHIDVVRFGRVKRSKLCDSGSD